MSNARKIRFGLWYDFRNPPGAGRSFEDFYGGVVEQVAWAEEPGLDSAWPEGCRRLHAPGGGPGTWRERGPGRHAVARLLTYRTIHGTPRLGSGQST